MEVQEVLIGLPHDVGPQVSRKGGAEPASGVGQFAEGPGPSFVPIPTDPAVIAITEAAAELTPIERAMALAAVRGIGSRSLRKV